MTIKDLSQLYYLNREIEHDQERLEQLRARSVSLSTPKMDGMPHGSGSEKSKTDWLMAEIIDLEAIIDAKKIQCIHERARLERYIAEVPDSLTRMILTLRFVNNLPWKQVAYSIGGGNTPDSVKKQCYRYLDSTEEDEGDEEE